MKPCGHVTSGPIVTLASGRLEKYAYCMLQHGHDGDHAWGFMVDGGYLPIEQVAT